jgi:methyl-accepting chemotaxis protein
MNLPSSLSARVLILLPLAGLLEASAAGVPPAASVAPVAEHATSLGFATIGSGALALLLLLAAVRSYARNGMQRWTVARRLAFGFSAILLVLAGLAVESYVSMHSALVDFQRYRADATHTNLASEIQIEVLEMEAAATALAQTRRRDTVERYAKHRDRALVLLTEEADAVEEPALKLRVSEIVAEVQEYDRLHVELQSAVDAGDEAAVAALGDRMTTFGETIDHHVGAIKTEFLAQQNQDGPRLAAELAHTQSLVIWLGAAAVGLGLGLAVIISGSIGGPLRVLADALGAGGQQTAAAAGQVSSSSQSLAQGASEQAASLEETSASLEELTSMTRRNADSSQGAQQAASETRAAALSGSTQMASMQSAMERINRASQDITKVLKTIDEIAFQTNILALNAAVEAARAGEHGAGFAVVAEEVRALAQRAAGAARETAGMIERSVGESRQGMEISASVAGSFESIRGRVEKLDQLVGEIATASAEQSKGIEQITQAVAQMDQVTQANAGSAEETAAAAEELNAQAVMLKDAVLQLQALVGIKPPTGWSRQGAGRTPMRAAEPALATA